MKEIVELNCNTSVSRPDGLWPGIHLFPGKKHGQRDCGLLLTVDVVGLKDATTENELALMSALGQEPRFIVIEADQFGIQAGARTVLRRVRGLRSLPVRLSYLGKNKFPFLGERNDNLARHDCDEQRKHTVVHERRPPSATSRGRVVHFETEAVVQVG